MRHTRGFTLIELMFTVAIMAILAAIALPSYSDYVRRGRLTETLSAMAGMRVKMEQFFQDNRTYAGAGAAGTVAPCPPDTATFTYSMRAHRPHHHPIDVPHHDDWHRHDGRIPVHAGPNRCPQDHRPAHGLGRRELCLLGDEARRIVLRQRTQPGFTLIELLVGLTLVGVLLAVGLPSLSRYIQQNKINSAAANYHAAISLARAEAIRANAPAEFLFTAGTGVAAAPALTGRNWVVRLLPPDSPAMLIDQKIASEGEGTTAQSVDIDFKSVPAGFDGRITFNGFGQPTKNPYIFDVTNPVLGACVLDSGPARCRRISVSAAGQVSACDPASVATVAAGDSRACY